jgi:hypothetical protein
MIEWTLATLACALMAWAGAPWARMVPAARPGPAMTWALGYLCGAALVTLGMLALAFVALPIDRITVLLTIMAVRLLGSRGHRRPRRTPITGTIDVWTGAGLAVIAAALAFGLLQAVRLGGIDSIDFLKAWGLKGVAVASTHNIDFSNLSGPHLFYPLLVSNLNAAVFLITGNLDDAVLRLPAALFGVALAASMWWLLRLVLPPRPVAAAIALTVTAPEFVGMMTSGLADLVVAAYITICALAAYLWLLDGGAGWASLSGFAAGAAAWTKLEGAPTCLVVLAAVLVVRRSWRPPGIAVWLEWFALFTVPWLVFQRLHGIPANRSHFKTIYLHPAWILGHVARTLGETSHWGIFWPLVVFTIAISVPLWWDTDLRFLAAVTVPNAFLTLGAYVTHYRAGVAGSVEATAHRLYLHLAPTLAVMAMAGAIGWRSRPPVREPELPDTAPRALAHTAE